jgi:hypothetical protein
VAAAVGGVAFLFLRGVLLWVVVPVGSVWWLVAWPWFRSRRVRLGQVLGWLDLNLVAAISHTVFRPLLRQPARYWRTDEMPAVTHRILVIDPKRPDVLRTVSRLVLFPPLLLIRKVPGLRQWARAGFRLVSGERLPRTGEEWDEFHLRHNGG